MDIRTSLLIKQVFLLHQQRLNKIFCEFDLTATQTFTLIYLFQSREAGSYVKQKDIERKMDISNPTVTGILNRLENKGLIQRIADEKDARAKHIVVTEKALELDRLLRQKFNEADKEMVASLSEEEEKQLQDMLIRMLHSS